MLHKEVYTIKSTDTSADVHDALSVLSAEGLEKVLPQIEAGTVIIEPQDENLVTYAQKLTKEESRLDWTQTADVLVRKIHGLNPWPVAHTLYNGNPMKIWQAEVLSETHTLQTGQVRATHKTFDVATGQGFVRIHELQLPNGKRMSASAFLAAHEVNGLVL
jgi:methionyl-tRNA formyltransferase